MLKKFNMGEQSAKNSGMSTMVVETNTTYDNEIKEGDEVEILLTYFDHDKKRLHFRLEMIEKKKNTELNYANWNRLRGYKNRTCFVR